jgi:hypothetical protein
MPSGELVTVYNTILSPPSVAGGENDTVTCWSFSPIVYYTATTLVGAPGTVAGGAAGVYDADATEATLLPIAFLAVTVNVYAVPLVKPVIVIGDALPVAVNNPGALVTV